MMFMPAPLSPYFDIRRDANGEEFMEVYLEGIVLLRLVLTNKGTAFTKEERKELKLSGLLPARVNTLEEQLERVYRGYRREPNPLSKYQYLRALQERHEVLFYALLEKHLAEMLPVVYTPTVGDAVQQFNYLYQYPRGISLSTENIDEIDSIFGSYALRDVRMIVATDASAILGLGDQGYGGLAIPIGKLALYTVAGGVSPFHTMPVLLDVGTERSELREDPMYLGVTHPRLRGEVFYAFLDRFVEAVEKHFPQAIVQWEDLAKDTAFTVLERYRHRIASFNDDIQGTGAVTLAGVINACRIKGEPLKEQTIVIYGAGAGGAGVAWALREGLVRAGLSRQEAARRILVLDSRGLLIQGRSMEAYKETYAQPPELIRGWQCAGEVPTLLEAITNSRATVLLGLSGRARAFNEPVIRAMSQQNSRPVIFALSNPTSACEALPEDLMTYSEGQAIIATGSPFADVMWQGSFYPVSQGNNAFIFPGLGLACVLGQVREVTDSMVLEAALALAEYTANRNFDPPRVYPPVEELQQASIAVAVRVLEAALQEGVTRTQIPGDRIAAFVTENFWHPRYLPVRRG